MIKIGCKVDDGKNCSQIAPETGRLARKEYLQRKRFEMLDLRLGLRRNSMNAINPPTKVGVDQQHANGLRPGFGWKERTRSRSEGSVRRVVSMAAIGDRVLYISRAMSHWVDRGRSI
jgi:hypothetical protein